MLSEIVGLGLIVTCSVSALGVQGNPGSLVVRMIFTLPFKISVAPGVYVVFNVVADEKVPLPVVDQLPVVADPPTEPFNETVWPWQIAIS